MITKAVLVSAAATGLFLAQPQNANAGTNVDVDVSVHPVQYDGDYSGYPSYDYQSYPVRHHDYDDEDDDYGRISCWEGRRILRRAGFYGARPIRCYGEIYRYSGWKRGHQWRISVDADTGRIVRARPFEPYY
jgi:hypothetical protein